MEDGRRWTVQDRYGNDVYLTEERWEHITEPINHPDMVEVEAELQDTIREGHRKQDLLNPQKYRYSKAFNSLDDVTPILLVSFYVDLLRAKAVIQSQTITS